MDWNNIFCLRNHPRFAGFGSNVSEPLQILSSECVYCTSGCSKQRPYRILYYIVLKM